MFYILINLEMLCLVYIINQMKYKENTEHIYTAFCGIGSIQAFPFVSELINLIATLVALNQKPLNISIN
jgi:hypothetical protein